MIDYRLQQQTKTTVRPNNMLHLTAPPSRFMNVAKIRAARHNSRVAWAAGELVYWMYRFWCAGEIACERAAVTAWPRLIPSTP
jgi:hypothetical protein